MDIKGFKSRDGSVHEYDYNALANKPDVVSGKDGGHYTPAVTQPSATTMKVEFTPSKPGMPAVEPVTVTLPVSEDSGENVDLTGYATEAWVQEGFQLKGDYLTTVPAGYATEEFVKNKIAEAELGGEEVDLSGYAQKSELPTKISQLTNDSGFITKAPVDSVNGKTGAVSLNASDVGARPDTWVPTAQEVGALPNTYVPPTQTAEQVGADAKGTAASAVSAHNISGDAHNDIRLLIEGLTTRLNALANSTDTDLDQMAELVAYIKSNKSLIDGITTSKVSIADIVDNLTTNVANKPLSAAQGVALKALFDQVPEWALATAKPGYTKSEVGLGNVDNVRQYSASNPPPYPVTSVNGQTGAVTVDVPTKTSQLTNDSGYLTEHQDISGKLDANKLPEAVEDALTQAKESGKFDGTSVTVKSVSESTEGGGSNVVTFSDGSTLTVKNGKDGSSEMQLTDFSMFEEWGIVGDSYACGHIVLDGVAERYPRVGWGQILARKCGNTCTAFAYSGLTTKTWLTDSHGLAMLQESREMQLYILALGINDANVGLDYLGAAADMDTYADSFYGNYAKIIDEIQTYAPEAKLIIATIASQEKNYPTFNTAIVAIAEHYGIPLIVQADDSYFQSDFYLANKIGGHPNAIAYSGMAVAFKRMIEKAMVEYDDYFASYVSVDGEDGDEGGSGITYTNLVPASIDTDGSIFNGTGYKDGYRLNSSGTPAATEGATVTGFIPCTAADTIRLKGAEWVAWSSGGSWVNSYVSFYDASLANVENLNNSGTKHQKVTTDPATITADANGVTTFALDYASGFEFAYIRISAKGNGADLIVTVNEEIT